MLCINLYIPSLPIWTNCICSRPSSVSRSPWMNCNGILPTKPSASLCIKIMLTRILHFEQKLFNLFTQLNTRRMVFVRLLTTRRIPRLLTQQVIRVCIYLIFLVSIGTLCYRVLILVHVLKPYLIPVCTCSSSCAGLALPACMTSACYGLSLNSFLAFLISICLCSFV